MQVSVIIFVNDVDLFHRTYQSVKNQQYTYIDVIILHSGEEKIISDISCTHIKLNVGDRFYDSCNKAIDYAKGEYVIFLKSGDILTNDRVFKEFVLNSPSEDLVFANTIITNENLQHHIFIPDILRISDLAINELPIQGIFFKRILLTENKGFDSSFAEEAARMFCIKTFNSAYSSYRHINFFVTTLTDYKLNTDELDFGLKKYFPAFADDMLELKHLRDLDAFENNKRLKKIGQSDLFKAIIKIRKLAEKKGFYELKASWKQKRYYKKITKRDEAIRKEIEQKIWDLPENLLTRSNDSSDIIVSLTSFGHRVEQSAPHAIYTLFTQKQLPNRIILFLDNDNWNENNIPPLLQKLQKSGLEILFCEDLRPYKKLIPAIQLYPLNTIITVDDDVYYNERTLLELLETYDKSDKKSVICHWAFIAEQRNGIFIPYSQWKDNAFGNLNSFLSPVGQDGVLYPAGIFDDEMIKSDIFMKLCTNDDIWFWIQEYRNKVNIQLVPDSSKSLNTYVKTVDQWAPTKKSALYYLNVIEGRNDINLKNLLEYYKIE